MESVSGFAPGFLDRGSPKEMMRSDKDADTFVHSLGHLACILKIQRVTQECWDFELDFQ